MAVECIKTDPPSRGSIFIGNRSPLAFGGVNLAPLPHDAPLQFCPLPHVMPLQFRASSVSCPADFASLRFLRRLGGASPGTSRPLCALFGIEGD